jgi:hypothetical protein
MWIDCPKMPVAILRAVVRCGHRSQDGVRFTVQGTDSQRVVTGLSSVDAEVAVHDELGSVSVVSAMVADRSGSSVDGGRFGGTFLSL